MTETERRWPVKQHQLGYLLPPSVDELALPNLTNAREADYRRKRTEERYEHPIQW
jgi:hypothetical protein